MSTMFLVRSIFVETTWKSFNLKLVFAKKDGKLMVRGSKKYCLCTEQKCEILQKTAQHNWILL